MNNNNEEDRKTFAQELTNLTKSLRPPNYKLSDRQNYSSINASYSDKREIFFETIRSRNLKIVKVLNAIEDFHVGIPENKSISTPMHVAAYYSQVDIVKLFLEDSRYIPGRRDSTNHTPAELAIIAGAPQEIIDLLTESECRAFLRRVNEEEPLPDSSHPKPKSP